MWPSSLALDMSVEKEEEKLMSRLVFPLPERISLRRRMTSCYQLRKEAEWSRLSLSHFDIAEIEYGKEKEGRNMLHVLRVM